jgi:hypothetical protein
MTIQHTLLLRSFAQFVLERLMDLPGHDYTTTGLFSILTALFFSEAALLDLGQQIIEMLLDGASAQAQTLSQEDCSLA